MTPQFGFRFSLGREPHKRERERDKDREREREKHTCRDTTLVPTCNSSFRSEVAGVGLQIPKGPKDPIIRYSGLG